MSVTPEEAQMKQFLASQPQRNSPVGKVVQISPTCGVSRLKGWLGVVVGPGREEGWWQVEFYTENLLLRKPGDTFTSQNVSEIDFIVIGDLPWPMEVY